VLRLRFWSEEAEGPWKKNIKDIGGGILAVSQFTLLARTDKGSKPDFHQAMSGPDALLLFDYFVELLQKDHGPVATGAFGEYMQVDIQNDGPVTIILEAS